MERVERESMNKKLGGEKKKMKTKNKVIAMVQITIVLCSLFLVSLPAIGVTTASEGDYVLGIYGNANEDDTIDMGDVVYTKLAIFGKKPKTELCDAKYDGRINVLDVIQTKLIILGKEKELTIVQHIGPVQGFTEKPVTISKPVERIVVLSDGEHAEALRILDAMDKVVGVSDDLVEWEYAKVFFPEFQDVPNIGHYCEDYEAILSVNPDAAITYTWHNYPGMEEHLPGVTGLRFNFYVGQTMFDEMRRLGYVLDNREEAQEYIDFVEGYENIVKEKVETLSEDEKPKVYIEGKRAWGTYNKMGGPAYQLRIAGCRNIAENLAGNRVGKFQIDPEYVIEQNPDIIIKKLGWSSAGGYGADDPSLLKDAIAEIMSRPELAHVKAVQNEKVYVLTNDINYHPSMIVSIAYFAKWFHPDLFKDLDPQAVHQEYLDTFHESLNWNVYEQGIFVYPPLED
jgi:iron complex transport system substrate-binding protein